MIGCSGSEMSTLLCLRGVRSGSGMEVCVPTRHRPGQAEQTLTGGWIDGSRDGS
jgi:hypothetical protein